MTPEIAEYVGPDGTREWVSCSFCERVLNVTREDHLREVHPTMCSVCELYLTYPSELDAAQRCDACRP